MDIANMNVVKHLRLTANLILLESTVFLDRLYVNLVSISILSTSGYNLTKFPRKNSDI